MKYLSMDSPSTLLSMERSSGHEEECERQGQRPPDINLPLSVEIVSHPGKWGNASNCDGLDVTLAPAASCHDSPPGNLAPSKGRRWIRRGDTIWGAWFFFNHYFRPVLTDKSQSKMSKDGMMAGPLDKSDLRLDLFLVQHDMENIYMWAFRERPENALGKMQLRSYMNGHARFGEPQFPFSADKGFSRSHRMQRKQYRGLSNPQCVHGVEVVRSPSFQNVADEDQKRWMELTGRGLNFSIPPDAEAFSEWRNVNSNSDFNEFHASPSNKPADAAFSMKKGAAPFRTGKPANDAATTTLNLTKTLSHGSRDVDSGCGKRRRKGIASNGNGLDPDCIPTLSFSGGEDTEQTSAAPCWLSDFTGVMAHASGPVTAAKSIYEDDQGYLIMVSLPFVDLRRLRVSWRNTATNGIVKVHCASTARAPFLSRGERTFKLTDANPEHCPPGEFVREIALSTRIPENADLKAFYVEACAGIEIIVPKHNGFSEEREVRVFLPPQLNNSEQLLSCHPGL